VPIALALAIAKHPVGKHPVGIAVAIAIAKHPRGKHPVAKHPRGIREHPVA
jgi:hypothetical protein